MSVKIQLRRDTAANWTSNNPTLSSGELGIETNTNKFKIGNGSTAWNSLSYFGTLFDENLSDNHTSGATGDIWYRNSGGKVVRLGIGSAGQVLNVSGGLPAWGTAAGGGLISYPIGGQIPYNVTIATFTADSETTLNAFQINSLVLPVGGTATFALYKNGSSIATVDITTGQSANSGGTYSTRTTTFSNSSLVLGDKLEVKLTTNVTISSIDILVK